MKSIARRTQMYVQTAPTVWTKVGRLTSVSIPSPEKTEIDATDFDSVAAESFPGLPNFGEITFGGNFEDADAGQAALFTDASDADAPIRSFRVDFLDQDVRFEFSAFVRRFQPRAGGINEMHTFEGALRVTGAPTKGTIP